MRESMQFSRSRSLGVKVSMVREMRRWWKTAFQLEITILENMKLRVLYRTLGKDLRKKVLGYARGGEGEI